MLNPIEINFKLDKTIKRAHSTELMIKSHDINVIEFHISFDGLELTADHTVKVLSVFNDTESQTNVNCDIVDGKAIYRPDTSVISQYEYVQNYVYLYHGEQSLDVRVFRYSVDLSKIDETALKVKEVYDQSYSDLLENFEQALTDYKDALPQASDLRAEIDVILNQFGVDSQAKLLQYDADAQQVIADNQTAFNLAENNRQSTYEQAEDSRRQASEQAVVDWEQSADVLLETVESNETARVDAEATRKTAEADRVSSETSRKTNETTRISNEDARKSAEVIRLANEAERVNAENVRSEFYEGFDNELDKKANKQQEAWITPTLLNGFTGDVKYRKTQFNQLEVIGYLMRESPLGNNTLSAFTFIPEYTPIWISGQYTDMRFKFTLDQDIFGIGHARASISRYNHVFIITNGGGGTKWHINITIPID